MKNIRNFDDFSINESDQVFFSRHNFPAQYNQRAKQTYELSDNPTVMEKVRSFFDKMEQRISHAVGLMGHYTKMRRAERGYGPDTGVEALFGVATVVPNVLKRVFGPTKFEKVPKEDEVDVKYMRHLNNEFAKNELPAIKSEEDLGKNIMGLYKKARINKGENPVLDDIARNRMNMYYSKHAAGAPQMQY